MTYENYIKDLRETMNNFCLKCEENFPYCHINCKPMVIVMTEQMRVDGVFDARQFNESRSGMNIVDLLDKPVTDD